MLFALTNDCFSMVHKSTLSYNNLYFFRFLVFMVIDDSIEIDPSLLDEIQSFATSKKIDIDDYLTLLLEEEILKEITVNLVSDSSIY